MKEEEIIVGNRLIAEFMGYKLITPELRKIPEKWSTSYWQKDDSGETKVLSEEHKLKYHKDWNWLMDVVKKINERDYVTIFCDECRIHPLIVGEFEIISVVNEDKPLILSVWQAVVEYIKWYNENKLK